MNELKFRIGGYTHKANEVYPRSIEMRPLFTDQNVRWGSAVRYEIAGDLCADPATPLTLSTVNAKVAELENAYLHDYQDFGFLINGSPSNHYVYNDDDFNLSGNRVLSRGFPYRGPNELANTRSFTVTLGATFQENYSQIISYRETVTQRGDGGKRWTYRSRFTGAPERQDIHNQTPVEMIQEGRIVGLNARPTLPDRYWPDDEVGVDRIVKRYSPKFHGHLGFDRGTHYGLYYRYRFLLATVPTQEPIEWRP